MTGSTNALTMLQSVASHLNVRKFSLKGMSMIGTVYPETSLNHQM